MKKIFIAAFFVMGMLAVSCKKLIDTKPLNLLVESDVWSNADLAQSYIYGNYYHQWLYENSNGFGEQTSGSSWGDWIATSTVKNDVTINTSTNLGWNVFANIRNLNIAIDHLTAPGAAALYTEAKRADMLGQAYFNKAVVYFAQARKFGGYPIIDKTLNPGDSLNLQRATIKQTYDYTIGLLQKSIPLLNNTPHYNAPGRVTRGAALAALSLVALQGGAYIKFYEHADPTPYYDIVIKATQDLDALGQYSLEDPDGFYKTQSNFAYGQTSKEVILGKYFLKDNTQTVNTTMILMAATNDASQLKPSIAQKYPVTGTIVNGYGAIDPAESWVEKTFYVIDLDGKARRWEQSQRYAATITNIGGVRTVNAGVPNSITSLMYGNRDQRFYKTIICDSSMSSGSLVYTRDLGNINEGSYTISNRWTGAHTGYLFRKCLYEDQLINNSSNTNYHEVVLRLASVYLNCAEAYLLEGNEAQAKVYINKTRVRQGGLPALTTETGAELQTIYQDERAAELVREGDLYWSRLRWGLQWLNGAVLSDLNGGLNPNKKLLIAADARSYSIVNRIYSTSDDTWSFSTRRYLCPIPQASLTLNPKLGPQNTGW